MDWQTTIGQKDSKEHTLGRALSCVTAKAKAPHTLCGGDAVFRGDEPGKMQENLLRRVTV